MLLCSVLTCDLGDALQGGYREGEDDALAGPHPQQALADQQAGDTNLTWNRNRHSTINMTTITAATTGIQSMFNSGLALIQNPHSACQSRGSPSPRTISVTELVQEICRKCKLPRW